MSEIAKHEYGGRRLKVREIATLEGVSAATVRARIKKGIPLKQGGAMIGGREATRVEYNGQMYTYRELSALCGMTTSTLYKRVNTCGWSVRQAVDTPPGAGAKPRTCPVCRTRKVMTGNKCDLCQSAKSTPSITEIAVAARNLGLTYGQYVARMEER